MGSRRVLFSPEAADVAAAVAAGEIPLAMIDWKVVTIVLHRDGWYER